MLPHRAVGQERLRAFAAAEPLACVLLLALVVGATQGGFRSESSAVHASSPETVPGLSSSGGDALTIRVTGYRWWWRVEYSTRESSVPFETANEIHLPLGRPARLVLASGDVIHRLSVPGLDDERDLAPGQETELWLQADREAVIRGRCAEPRAQPHEHAELLVVAEPDATFDDWRARQQSAARDPLTEDERHGREVFAARPCGICHTVRGTPASGKTAPDLTHLASRLTLPAATPPGTPGHLAGWLAAPRTITPASRTPLPTPHARELEALLTYLESLE
jgi:cytochrome c oxidase subunit 2